MSILILDVANLWNELSFVFKIVLNFAGISLSVVLNVAVIFDIFLVYFLFVLEQLGDIQGALFVYIDWLSPILGLRRFSIFEAHFSLAWV